MPSYAYLCRKAGLPDPKGFAKIEPVPLRAKFPDGGLPIKTTPDFIAHTAVTFMACCNHKQAPGPNLQAAILVMLNELRALKTPAPISNP